MVKQRRESITMYEQGGRQELADIEAGEVAVIEDFLPAQLSEDEAKAAIAAIVAQLGASSLKDMGRVMAAVKERHGSELRSEEHTSELQSLMRISYAVFCLKKKRDK